MSLQQENFKKSADKEKEKEKYSKPSKQKYMKLEAPVDENTVIPEMPKDLIKEPNFDEMRSKCNKIKDQRQELGKVLKDFIQNTISAIKNKKSQTRLSVAPLTDDLDIKLKKYKELKLEFESARQALDQKKAAFDAQQEKCETIKLKMKNAQGSLAQIEAEIANLKETLSDAKVSVKQEKDIVQRISQLETVMPHAIQLDLAQTERLAEKKEAQAAYFKFRDESNNLKNQVNKIRDTITELSSMTTEEQTQVQPVIDAKKEEINKKIEKLNEQIVQLNEKFDSDKEKFKEQKKLIERIEWIKKEQKSIIREKKEQEKAAQLREKRKIEQQEETERREAEEKELADDPYDENVSVCTLLIDYCKKLMPKTMDTKVQDQVPQKDISQVLSQKDWKKDNVSLVVNKKSIDEDIQIGNKKAKKQKIRTQVFMQSQAPKDDQLLHQVDVLNYFEHVKVSPPLFSKSLQQTLTILEEKKSYFQNLPKDQKQTTPQKSKVQKERQVSRKQQDPSDFQESSFPSL